MTYLEMSDHIETLLQEQLGIRGKSLERRLKKAGRLLPKSVHKAGAELVQAVKLQASPKLSRRVSDSDVQNAYRACETYLSQIDPWQRKKAGLLNFLSLNAFYILVTAALVAAVMYWRNLI